MIPSTVTHVQQGLQKQLDLMLASKDSSYIINALLKDYDKDVVKGFIKRYAIEYDGDGAVTEHDRVPIKVVSAFPERETQNDTLIFIAPGEGRQSNNSIGSFEGGSIQKSGERITEEVELHVVGEKITMVTSQLIGNNFNIPDLAMDTSFYKIDNQTVTLNISLGTLRNLNLEDGSKLTVVYDTKMGKEFGSVERGYTAREEVQIHIMSANQNTILILDGLVKVALIMMTTDAKYAEGQIFNNPLISYQPLMPVDSNSIPSLPHIKFIRELDISYEVSYSFAYRNFQELKHVFYDSDLLSK